MNKKVIIINGTGGSGKDTFVEFCAEFARVTNISSVDPAKAAAKVLVGWEGEKDDKARKLLVDLKKLSIDYNDAPAKYIKSKYEEKTTLQRNAKRFMQNGGKMGVGIGILNKNDI